MITVAAPGSSPPRTEIATVAANVLAEDRAKDDVTTRWSVPDGLWSGAEVVAKQPGTIAGTAVVAEVMNQVDPRIRIEQVIPDGSRVDSGAVIIRLEGPTRSLLTGERTALNFLQRLSGIASLTSSFVQAIGDLPVRILDTRKTAPGLRALDKYAVTTGGGHNHRLDLGAMVLLKENHIAAAGGVTAAIDAVRQAMADEDKLIEIEVEVQDLAEAEEALRAAASRIMLDNFSLDDIRAAVQLRRRLAAADTVLEASGNVTLAGVREIAATGVDLISVGALTHSAPALDLTMLVTQQT
ncbi:carboxylating nicotinate-nucleotide diphosphorylase [Microlunatus speluncae]|uniref:carboxylating nicotinate-nucleotide diphosphorylase n=1 Tax=Microlunatus speluncae TaxID=2594267 RepID=UPI0012665E1F|nr:carboxylating nicotinate-nucleotide diphosphorylase [Microlunatus speluncae]